MADPHLTRDSTVESCRRRRCESAIRYKFIANPHRNENCFKLQRLYTKTT